MLAWVGFSFSLLLIPAHEARQAILQLCNPQAAPFDFELPIDAEDVLGSGQECCR